MPHTTPTTVGLDFARPDSTSSDNCIQRTPLMKWLTILGDVNGAMNPGTDERSWQSVSIPHNWDDYHGYHEVSHGNLHGTAWYRSHFVWNESDPAARLYAFFEGVGSYAKVFCNGTPVGEHAGGRTTFTVDLTEALVPGSNSIAVRADHPEKITDLPFVCGGCWGAPNTEGSQPFGIFRPVWLERTGPVRVEPFGIHVLTPTVSNSSAVVEVRTELHNADTLTHTVRLVTELISPEGRIIWQGKHPVILKPGEHQCIIQTTPALPNPALWAPDHPNLHHVRTTLFVGSNLSYHTDTPFGIRWLEWPEVGEENSAPTMAAGNSASSGGAVRILNRNADAPAGIDPSASKIFLHDAALPSSTSLKVCLNLQGKQGTEFELLCEIQNGSGTVFFHQERTKAQLATSPQSHEWIVPALNIPQLWTEANPCLHRLVIEIRSVNGTLWERSEIFFGIHPTTDALNLEPPAQNGLIENHRAASKKMKVLRLNGKPLFLNGTCEYENLLGCDHAFTDEQIAADVTMMRSAGFNAFRDAHHPHNLRYYDHWDRLGIVCWTQMGSHIWFDNPRFRENYKRLVAEWVRERRNHPCIILWGLQNESLLPEDFALELRNIIRDLDPTSPAWRLTTTCNGGVGSDWNVPQEWSGTYGGNCNDYDLEACKLVGEYGAWRKFGTHREDTYCGDENDGSETWACYAMETKIRLGEAARHRSIGHFHWIFNSFQNPGRTADNHEGPGNAAIGSVNNKGLVTAWHQPSDLYYLFRANYADPLNEPMVYIVSHTWPERWREPGPKTVQVFSNCEEVELFNGIDVRSLGTRRQPGRGRHFVWEQVTPQSRIFYAVGRVRGKKVARDIIVFDHLPADKTLATWLGPMPSPLNDPGVALFRVSCGADTDTTDSNGRCWQADRPWTEGAPWGWLSWGNRFENVPPDIASRGFTMTPVRGTAFPELYRTYRYGRNDLKYRFAVQPGSYVVRLHFTEPWFGVGGGLDASRLRLFDVAINGTTLATDVDIWKESGGDHRALIREFPVSLAIGILEVHFPKVRVGQAILSGIELFKRGALHLNHFSKN